MDRMQCEAIEKKAQYIAELAADIQAAANVHTACERCADDLYQSGLSRAQQWEKLASVRKRETVADATKTGILRKTLLLRRELLKLDALIKG
jgi:hypothetical protein